MKKILVSFATLAVVSSSIMTTTAWAKNNQHIQTKDTDHQLGRDTDYSDLDFGNFQSVMHPFDFQSLDPTIADVNVNIWNIDYPYGVCYNEIAFQLDQRLANFYSQFGISDTVLLDSISVDTLGTNFKIIDQNTEKQWVPPTLQSGQYECYNLKLVNLLSHTSFTFSLNYCNFDLNSTIVPIGDNFPQCTSEVNEIYSAGGHIWAPNDLSTTPTIDLSSYLQNMNDSSIKWKDVKGTKWKDYLLRNDNFFMSPITWNWDAQVNEDDDQGGAHASVNASSDSAGYNSQIGYENVESHNGLTPFGNYFGPSNPNSWNPNTFSNAQTFNYGSLVQDGSSGYPDYTQVNNVWDSDATYNDRGGWNACETTLLYIAQGYMGGNQFEFCPYEGGFSNVEDFPTGDGPWNITWTFNTWELDTSYKDIFSQAIAYQVTGLEDYSTFMTYKDPNKILKNYAEDYGVNEIYDLYDSAQTVAFNSNYVTSATVDGQSIPNGTPYTINQGSHVIDVRLNDPQQATEYQGNYDSAGDIEFHMDVQTGYDFSQGINAATWDPTTRMLDIYFNQAYANFLGSSWADEYGPGKTAYLLSWIRDYKVKGSTWSSLLNPNIPIDALVDTFIPTPSHETDTFKNLDKEVTSAETGGRGGDYAWALQNKIATPKKYPSLEYQSLNPTKGLILKLKIGTNRAITVENNPSLGEVPNKPYVKQKITGQDDSSYSNYWDEVLFNQL